MRTNSFGAPILVTLPYRIEGEVETICALLRAGAPRIHLRKPDLSHGQLEDFLCALQHSGAEMGRLSLHHDVAIARRYAVGGVHLRGDSLQEGEALRKESPQLLLSAPAHSWSEAALLTGRCDYVLLSPLFDSLSKPGYRSAFSLQESRAVLSARAQGACERRPAECGHPNGATLRVAAQDFDSGSLSGLRFGPGAVVALGGICADNLPSVCRAGFDGAAVLGELWQVESSAASGERLDLAATVARYRLLARRWRAASGVLQLISDGDLRVAEAFLHGGGRWIQLRMKEASPQEILARGAIFRTLCQRYDATFLLDDDPLLARRIGAHGVHLGQNDVSPQQARALLGEQAVIGCTANTFEQIKQIARTSADYIGCGPFRHTTTKKNLAALLGVEGYRNVMERMATAGIHLPLVGIGGVELEDLPSLLETGIDGVAVSGAIARARSPQTLTERFLETIRCHRKVR